MSLAAARAFGGLPEGLAFANRYRIEGPLGLSRRSALYRVVDTRTSRKRALKLLLPSLLADADARARFEHEARVTASIECIHIVEVTDAGIDAETGLPFLVMELLEGRDLAALVEMEGPLPPRRVLDLVRQVGRGLERTFAHGIAHRDIKPENLFLHQPGTAEERVVILDFGIAKSLQGSGSHTDAILGTPLYLAPEQIQFKRDTVGPAADLYALAMVTYTLLVGEPYYAEEEQAADGTMQFFLEVVAGITERPVARARRRRGIALPPEFDAWFDRATALAAGNRFPSPADLVAALRATLTRPLHQERSSVAHTPVDLTVVDLTRVDPTQVDPPLAARAPSTLVSSSDRPVGAGRARDDDTRRTTRARTSRALLLACAASFGGALLFLGLGTPVDSPKTDATASTTGFAEPGATTIAIDAAPRGVNGTTSAAVPTDSAVALDPVPPRNEPSPIGGAAAAGAGQVAAMPPPPPPSAVPSATGYVPPLTER